MPAIRTKEPIQSINASPHPQANRVAKEEYLTYDYPTLTLYEDFSSGIARKTKWFAVLKDEDQTTVYFERGTQAHNSHLTVGHEAFKGEWFSSAFIAAKALDEHLARGAK